MTADQFSSERNWKTFIESIKAEIKNESGLTDKKQAISILKQQILDSIEKNLPESRKEKVGIAFSGGVDSSTIALICKQLKQNFCCYSVGLENAEDIIWAKKVAKRLGFKLKIRILTIKDVEKQLKKLSKILPELDVVKAGVGLVTLTAAEMAKKDKIKMMFTGLGSEEIFAGYQRHLEASENKKDVNEECWNGLSAMYQRDIMRDLPILQSLKMKAATPLLDVDVIKTAMRIPTEYKINKVQNKIIFREVAQSMGLPKEFAQRKKRAAQYGSRFDKAIEKLAKIKGFGLKKEYLRSLN